MKKLIIRKKILFIIITCIVLLAAVIGAIMVLYIIHPIAKKVTTQQTSTVTLSPDTLKAQADKAFNTGETSQAKQLYTEARQGYVKAKNLSAVAEIDARLYLINHPPAKVNITKPQITTTD